MTVIEDVVNPNQDIPAAFKEQEKSAENEGNQTSSMV